MIREIWIVAESDGERLVASCLEALGEAVSLGQKLNHPVVSVLLGHGLAHLAEELIHHGADRVCLIDHELLADYSTDGYTKVLFDLIGQDPPRAVLFGGSRNGLDLASRLGARLKTGLVTNCTLIKSKGDRLELTQPIYGDRIYRILTIDSPPPALIATKPGSIGLEKPDKSRRGEIVEVRPRLEATDIRTRVIASFKAGAMNLDLEETDVLVVGGRGVGSREKWKLIEELAEAIGGGVGGTRLALDAGWIDRNRLIGQTGRSVAPRLCLEAGVSGALQHAAGLREAGFLIAINEDKAAPIFSQADVGVVADLHRLIPALIAKLGQRRASGPTQG